MEDELPLAEVEERCIGEVEQEQNGEQCDGECAKQPNGGHCLKGGGLIWCGRIEFRLGHDCRWDNLNLA